MSGKQVSVLLVVLALISVACASTVSAQGVRYSSLKFGYFNPKDAEPGLLVGGSWRWGIDEAVDLGFAADFYHKNYTKVTDVADTAFVSGINQKTVRKELEYATTILPVYFTATVRIPATYTFGYHLAGSIGYEFMWNKEKNFQDDVTASRFYNGLAWQVAAGVSFEIGSRSSLLLEGLYSSSNVKRNRETKAGLPVWDQVNLSGLGVRGGLQFTLY